MKKNDHDEHGDDDHGDDEEEHDHGDGEDGHGDEEEDEDDHDEHDNDEHGHHDDDNLYDEEISLQHVLLGMLNTIIRIHTYPGRIRCRFEDDEDDHDTEMAKTTMEMTGMIMTTGDGEDDHGDDGVIMI